MKTARNTFVLLTAAAICASWRCAALADPITYTFIANGPIAGTLGDVAIGGMNQFLTFTFVSDTSDVQPFTFGDVHGWEDLVGAASITVTDVQTEAIVAQATFSPYDAIFISVDNKNGGVGFGSDGSVPSDPSFPGNPAYPFALVPTGDSTVFNYDLKNDVAFSDTLSISCLGFPGNCITPIPLATTAGALVLGAPGQIFNLNDVGEFTATVTSNTAPAPEPGTWALMAIGLAALGFMRRKALRLSRRPGGGDASGRSRSFDEAKGGFRAFFCEV